MLPAASPLAELADDALPVAAGGFSGGGACITSSNKLYERCSKGNKTCWKGKLSYPSNIHKTGKKTAPLPTNPHKESPKHIATGYDHNFITY